MRTQIWQLIRGNRLRGQAPFSNIPSGGGAGGGGAGPIPQPAPAGAASNGFPPAPYQESAPRGLSEAASRTWVRGIVDVVNNGQAGKLNIVLPITLAANNTMTTIVDARIGAASAMLFSPLTANAAAEVGTLYVSSQENGQAVLAHSNSAAIDRSFNAVILG